MQPIKYFSFLPAIALVTLICITVNTAEAQIKIGTNGATIAPSSILELESANQGLLLPRLADTAAINGLNPPNGMLIYLTKVPAVGLYVRKVSGWEYLTGSLGGNGNFNSLTVAGNITAGSFSGPLNGNATSANTALSANTSLASTVTNDLATAVATYPVFVTQTPGSTPLMTSTTQLSFVPNTGILTARGFSGDLVGNVTGNATSSTNSVNASNTDITDDIVGAAVHYPTFVSGTTGNLPQKTSSTRLSFVPQTGELRATTFQGNLTGNATTANTSLNATNAANVAVTNDITTPTVAYPVFANAFPGNQALHVGSSNLSYVPSTGILTSRGFAGPLTGNVTGTATAAVDAENTVNMRVTNDVTSATPMYPTFVNGSAGPLPPRVSNANLSFIPQTGELTAPSFRGALVGNASSATTVTGVVNAVNGGTGHVNYSPGDILYAATSTSLARLPIGVNNTVLRVVGGVPTWSTAGAGTVTGVTGVANRITVTDNFVAPIVDIHASYAGQTSINTVGTITTGNWNAGVIPVSSGGTGRASLTLNEILVGGGTGPVVSLPLAGTAGRVLTSNGPGALPTFETPGIGDMVRAVDQVVTAPKRFTDGNLVIRGTGTGETTLRADPNSIGVARFPAGTYTLVSTDGVQTISGKTFATGTTFNGTTTLSAISSTSQNTTGNITAGSFTGPLTGNVTGAVTGNATSATTFTTALVGEVSGGQNSSNTQIDGIGIYPRATVLSLLGNVGAATQNNDNNTIVQRNAFGNFSAGTITANLNGNSATSTRLATARNIFNYSFDGTADLTGVIEGTFGGTGVNNAGRLITVAGDLTTVGANPLILTTIGATNVTLPTAGKLYGTAGGSMQSSELINSLADETGTGQVVFATNPTLVRAITSSLLADPGATSNTTAINPGVNVGTISVSGTNLAGTVTIVLTGPGTANNSLVTVSYSTSFPTGSYPILFPANSATAELGSNTKPTQVYATGANDGFAIFSSGTPLVAGTYSWNYQVVGR